MFKAYLWLIILHFAINSYVLAASDDREHVHIKVHMPNVLRKHNHYHKVKKYLRHHHQQPRQRPKKVLYHQPIDAESLYGHDNIAQQFFPTPYQLPVLPEPELVADEDDYETDIMSAAAYEGDATTFPQPSRPAVPPPALHTTQVPQLRQQLMQQLFSPEIMSALTSGGSMAGGGVSADTNSLLANDFLAELQKEYAKKLQEQKLLPVKLKQTKKQQKHKKYSSKDRYQQDQEDRYQQDLSEQQQPQAQQQQQQFYSQQQPPYNSNFPSNNIFEAFLQPYGQHQQQQQQHQHRQHIQQDFDDDLDEMMDEEFDDKTSSEDFGGESYQDMYAAYTQTTPMQPPTTTPTRLQWWQYQQPLQHQQPFQPKLQNPLKLPSVRLPTSLSSSPASMFGNGGLGNRFETGYKKRKNRVKVKRNRIVVL